MEENACNNPNFERFGIVNYAEKSVPETEINIEKLLVKLSYLLKFSKDKDICISKKANKCTCKDECWCVDENYYIIPDIKIIWGSNCNIILSISKPKNLNLRRKSGWCIYSLERDCETPRTQSFSQDCETPIFDVLNYPKNSSKKDDKVNISSNRWLKLQFGDPKNILLEVKEYSIGKTNIELTVGYMDWKK